jgi:hypothetical protein
MAYAPVSRSIFQGAVATRCVGALSPPNDDFGKMHVATRGRANGGERDVVLSVPADEEAFAEGGVILWTIPPDTLRDLFSPPPVGAAPF